MMNEITTVFIILNYKTYKDTLVLVDSLLEQGLGNRRIIIIDNASPNESYEILNAKYGNNGSVDVIYSEENGGFSKGNNIGLRFAKKYNPRYACVINNDVRFSISTIQELEQIYETIHNVGIVVPKQIKPDGTDERFGVLDAPTFWYDFSSYIPGYTRYFERTHVYSNNTGIEGLQRVGFIPGAFIFIKYDTFESLNFFEELTFLFCEERILCKKLTDSKLDIYILFNQTYIHDHSATINSEIQLREQRDLIFEGRVRYTKKYRSCPMFKIFLLRLVYKIRQLWDCIYSKIK